MSDKKYIYIDDHNELRIYELDESRITPKYVTIRQIYPKDEPHLEYPSSIEYHIATLGEFFKSVSKEDIPLLILSKV
jgi:hypothetical protein